MHDLVVRVGHSKAELAHEREALAAEGVAADELCVEQRRPAGQRRSEQRRSAATARRHAGGLIGTVSQLSRQRGAELLLGGSDRVSRQCQATAAVSRIRKIHGT
jgi:hypothetical protein